MLALGFFLGAATLEAQMIEEADPLPSGVSAADLQALEEQKNGLDDEFREITDSLQEYNTFCQGYLQNSTNALSCQGRYFALEGRMSTYQASLLRYRSAIRKASGE